MHGLNTLKQQPAKNAALEAIAAPLPRLPDFPCGASASPLVSGAL